MAQGASRGEGRGHVIGIRGVLVVRLMAGIAVGGRARKLSVDVATGARHVDVRAGKRKSGGVVIEAGRNPSRGVMAHLALLGESRRRVVGIVSPLEILQVAGDARRVEIGELAAHVATLALQCGVRAGEREPGGGVIELGIGPRSRAVANGAVRGEACRRVVGIIGFLIIRHVAGRAGGRLQIEIVVHVALRARHGGVSAGQGEAGGGMVKGHILPGSRVVTRVAGRGKSGSRVVGIGGLLEIGHVTGRTNRRGRFEVAVDVTLRAGHVGMAARQGPAGNGVIEGHIQPGRCVVARLASRGESGGGVAGIIRFLKISHVAVRASGGCQREVSVEVALGTSQVGVPAGQRKTGDGVIEIHIRPRAGVVTRGAGGGKAGLDVIRIIRCSEIFSVTAHAIDRRAFEVVAHVAGIAIQTGVHTGQGKTGVTQVIELHP